MEASTTQGRLGVHTKILLFLFVLAVPTIRPLGAHAQSSPPNIVVIFTDDVGVWNISAKLVIITLTLVGNEAGSPGRHHLKQQ